jgi:hypothetical protein
MPIRSYVRSTDFHCHGRWLDSFRKLPAPPNRQSFSAFSEVDLTICELKSRFGEFCTTAVAFFLKGWVFRPSCKKVTERFLQVSQSLLQRNATNIVQKLEVFLFLPLGQHRRSIAVANSFLLFIPGFGSQCQSTVIDQTSAAHRSPKQIFLFGRWIKTILECFLGQVSHYSTLLVRSTDLLASSILTANAPIPPRRFRAGFLGGF